MRQKYITLAPEILAMLLIQGKENHFIVEKGLPEGTQIVGVRYDELRKEIQLLIEHESFDEVPVTNVPGFGDGIVCLTIRN